MKTVDQLKIEGQRVFLRADLNVPIKNGTVTDDFKLEAILPTLQKLKDMNPAKIILATHIGQPTDPDESLSTKQLVSWFTKKGFKIAHAGNVSKAHEASLNPNDSIILLENLRFFPGETRDAQKKEFTEELFDLADLYVNDAFGSIHRDHASLSSLPQLFSPDNRGIGLLMWREKTALTKLKQATIQPFVIIAGGNKLSTKLPMIRSLFSAQPEHRPQVALIGGRLSHAFLRAQGDHNPLFDVASQEIGLAREIIDLAQKQNISLILPEDYVTATVDGNKRAVDIGMKSVKKFSEALVGAQTIFLNGTMGMYEYPEGTFGTDKICHAIAQSEAKLKIVGGGDTTSAIRHYKLADKFNLVSTGGGSLLAFLAAQNPEQELPGLAALNT